MNEIIIDSLVDKFKVSEQKMEAHERSIQELQLVTSTFKDQSDNMMKLSSIIREVESGVKSLYFPEEKMSSLIHLLKQNRQVMAAPPDQKVVHEHRAHRIIWATVGLFIITCLISFGWYSCSQEADQYQAADMHWRYLKLVMDPKTVKHLHQIELNYQNDKEQVVKWVEKEELRWQQQQEAREKAAEAEQQAKNYRKVAGDAAVADEKLTKNKHLKPKSKPVK